VLIVCKQCHAEYDLDPPAVPFARDQDLVFRCSSCGTSIPIRTEAEAVEEPVSPVDQPVSAHSQEFVLRQDGKTYTVGDAAMLQRWIVERRVGADDEISEGGEPFHRVGEIEAFQIFFQLVQDVEQSASAKAAIEVPTPAFVGKASSAKLFSRPSTVGLSGVDHSTPVKEPKSGTDSASDLRPETPPESDPETEVKEFPPVESEPEPVTEEAKFGEAIPDEGPADFSDSPLDEPTMDMELGQDDFFSEEETVIADRVLFQGDEDGFDDDDLEWGQTRRKNMAMWWLIFFAGLGGAGYFTLDFISSPEKETMVVAEPEAAEPPPVAVDQEGDKQDTAAPDPEAAASPSDGPQDSADAPGSADAKDTPQAATSAPEPAKPAPKEKASGEKKPTPPARPNAAREIDRGWAQIDRANWKAAAVHFNKALSVAPGSVDGRYGMAYVNEHQGRVAEAVRQYCRLAKTTTGEIRNEVSGRLRSLGKECP
jgi:hypothetical protein